MHELVLGRVLGIILVKVVLTLGNLSLSEIFWSHMPL